MELTPKQEQMFIEFYRWLYGDTSKATWTWELPTITEEEKEAHIKMWKDKLKKIIWPKKALRTYKIRPYGPQSYLDYAFSWLWLWYWPSILKSKKQDDTDKDSNVKTDSVQEVWSWTE